MMYNHYLLWEYCLLIKKHSIRDCAHKALKYDKSERLHCIQFS